MYLTSLLGNLPQKRVKENKDDKRNPIPPLDIRTPKLRFGVMTGPLKYTDQTPLTSVSVRLDI